MGFLVAALFFVPVAIVGATLLISFLLGAMDVGAWAAEGHNLWIVLGGCALLVYFSRDYLGF